jgi:hypothetical protein
MSTIFVDNIQPNLDSQVEITNLTTGTGHVVGKTYYTSGWGSGARTTSASTSWYTLNIYGTGAIGARAPTSNNIIQYTKKLNTSHLLVNVSLPIYITPGTGGVGVRCYGSTTVNDANSYTIIDPLTNGPAHGWGAAGYGGNTAAIINFTWSTQIASNASTWLSKVGACGIYFQGTSFSGSDTAYWIDYDNTYPKYASMTITEVVI